MIEKHTEIVTSNVLRLQHVVVACFRRYPTLCGATTIIREVPQTEWIVGLGAG